MLVSDFDYQLPPDLIAQQPPRQRGASRMLRLDRQTGQVRDGHFEELPALLAAGDLLVLNDSRVLPGRLFATRRGLRTQAGSAAPDGLVEVLLTESVGDETCDGGSGPQSSWRALVKPAKKVAVGETLLFAEAPGSEPVLTAEVTAAAEFGERTLRFSPTTDLFAILERIGHLPLPPYIHRTRGEPNTPEDRERYQTVYSQPFDTQGGVNEDTWRDQQHGQIGRVQPSGDRTAASMAVTGGSAAAPTAGLHFTPEMLARLEAQGVEIARVTLHVGLGTFQPVRVDRTEEIRLHAEPYTLGADTAEALNKAWSEGRRIVAVGTTTTRTLEHVARQFEASWGALSPENPLRLESHSGSTGLFLSPGPDGDDRFKLVRGLLTNFHLPQSTLLMLVSAFAGRDRVLAAYAHAVQQRYRFFSYGDCMLVL